MLRRSPSPTLFPYTTLFRSDTQLGSIFADVLVVLWQGHGTEDVGLDFAAHVHPGTMNYQNLRHNVYLMCCKDRKSTRLNSSHLGISYAVFCLKKKNKNYIVH